MKSHGEAGIDKVTVHKLNSGALPLDVHIDLVDYLIAHEQDIAHGVNDFGDLQNLFVSVMERQASKGTVVKFAGWTCKYCGDVDVPGCNKCVRYDGKLVSDELVEERDERL